MSLEYTAVKRKPFFNRVWVASRPTHCDASGRCLRLEYPQIKQTSSHAGFYPLTLTKKVFDTSILSPPPPPPHVCSYCINHDMENLISSHAFICDNVPNVCLAPWSFILLFFKMPRINS